MKTEMNMNVNFEVRFTLDETEARALDAIVGYGVDKFLEVFKKHLGEHYIRDHESGVISLFNAVQNQVCPALSRITRARQLLKKGGV